MQWMRREDLMKVIEWNINHRYGHSKKKMPKWIKDVIDEEKATIIVLTEASFKIPNWEDEYRNLFDRNKYYVFCSNNTAVGNNEVTIAIEKDCFNIEYIKSYLSEGHLYPDHLEVHCIHKITKKKFVVVGVRIHAMNISNQQKREEFNTVLESVKYDENVMIVGDFNNYRRGFDDSYWCLSKIDELVTKEGFSMYTPQGGSIYKDNDGAYSFPEDHIFIKGQLNINTCKYERSLFTNRDTTVYKWKTDFQKYRGKDKNGEYLYDNIDDPFPDHAIIEAGIHLPPAY